MSNTHRLCIALFERFHSEDEGFLLFKKAAAAVEEREHTHAKKKQGTLRAEKTNASMHTHTHICRMHECAHTHTHCDPIHTHTYMYTNTKVQWGL